MDDEVGEAEAALLLGYTAFVAVTALVMLSFGNDLRSSVGVPWPQWSAR